MAGTLWVGTRKGAWALRADARRRSWKLAGPQFLGHIIHHAVQDPREPEVVLLAAKTGHLGPTVFRSKDRGERWEPVAGFNDHPMLATWAVPPGSPIGQLLHSILVDPRDPHCVAQRPAMPDRHYQQNHCGIYRLDRPATRWVRNGEAMPQKIGDIGFPVVLHPQDPDQAWVFPMDGTTVWPRTSVGGRPAVHGTRNAGRSVAAARCRAAARAGLCCARRCARMRASDSACTSARPPARCGRAPTRASRGAASRATCRRSTR